MVDLHTARNILGRRIEQGRSEQTAVIRRMLDQQPADMMVQRRSLRFGAEGGRLTTNVDGAPRLHRHALAQLASDSGIITPTTVTKAAEVGPVATEALVGFLNRVFGEALPEQRRLVRSVDGEVRGYLSDRYRRIDSAPILEAFISGAQARGAVPITGRASDIRWGFTWARSELLEVNGEALIIGLRISNSDFGAGALDLRGFVERLICANGMTTESALRQVHLGRRLSDDIAWSDRTMQLDTEAHASAVGDAVHHLLDDQRIAQQLATIEDAAQDEIDGEREVKRLVAGQKLGREEGAAVREIYRSADVSKVPAGNTRWRLANAISLLAGQAPDADKRGDLEQLAGNVLQGATQATAR